MCRSVSLALGESNFSTLSRIAKWISAMGFSMSYGPADDETSLKTLQRAVDLGCTFWDTAVVYGKGHNEKLIGEFFAKTGTRDKVFIGSKCGFDVSDTLDLADSSVWVDQVGNSAQSPTVLLISKSTLKALENDLVHTLIYTISTVLTPIHLSRSLSLLWMRFVKLESASISD
jgi:aryl-alcohol dehydrogenase-like predicted oxidoreductase